MQFLILQIFFKPAQNPQADHGKGKVHVILLFYCHIMLKETKNRGKGIKEKIIYIAELSVKAIKEKRREEIYISIVISRMILL